MDLDVYFNEWAFLARTDPEVFERRRSETIAGFLDRCGPRRPQLEALQAKIDAQRRSAATAEESMAAITVLMCESLATLGGEIVKLCADLNEIAPPPRPVAALPPPRPTQEGVPEVPERRRPALSLSSRSRSG